MDIICARCGRHLSSVEAAREHSKSCAYQSAPDDKPIKWVQPKRSKVSAQQWQEIVEEMIESAHPPSETTKEFTTNAYPNSQPSQPREYVYKNESRDSLGNIHSKGKYSNQSNAAAWIALGITIFFILLLVLAIRGGQ